MLLAYVFISIFAALRLTLVTVDRSADSRHLIRALFGILMLLPQTDAFHLLRNRLQCVPRYNYDSNDTLSESGKSVEDRSPVDFDVLFEHFRSIQTQHQQIRIAMKRRNVILLDRADESCSSADAGHNLDRVDLDTN